MVLTENKFLLATYLQIKNYVILNNMLDHIQQ